MLYQFRMRKWDGLLRRRIGNVKLEQLLTPVSMVTADLITGREVVRDRGDATHASANCLKVSMNTERHRWALICSTQIDHRFGTNTPDMPADQMRARSSQWQTIRRAQDILPERGADLVLGR